MPADVLAQPVDGDALQRTLREVAAILVSDPGPSEPTDAHDVAGSGNGAETEGPAGVDTTPISTTPGWEDARQRRQAQRRWQQLCTAVAAKGVEDTACYRFGGSLAQADVGATPDDPAVQPAEFHEEMQARSRNWPLSLNTTSSHDSKRSEDVRARMAALTEIAGFFDRSMNRWSARHSDLVTTTTAGPSPDRFEERFCYQTMAGIWPSEPLAPTSLRSTRRSDLLRRLQAYSQKAGREAKHRSSWTAPDGQHERAVSKFLARLLTTSIGAPFVADMDRLTARIGPAAATNSLALTVVRSLAPGVPDLYQGCESWAFTLVDPDNRLPLDLDAANRRLDALEATPATDTAALLGHWSDGLVKLHVTRAALQVRQQHRSLFRGGAYLPITCTGQFADHGVAFARQWRGQWVVALVPRLPYRLAGSGRFPCGSALWTDTALLLPAGAPTTWIDALTGRPWHANRRRLSVGRVLESLPVAVLVGRTTESDLAVSPPRTR